MSSRLMMGLALAAILAASSAAQVQSLEGFDVIPTGQATVAPASGPSGSYLHVGNLGPSANGASIQANHMDGIRLGIDPSISGVTVPFGGRLVFSPRGSGPQGPQQQVGPAVLRRLGAGWEFRVPRAAFGVTSVTWELWLDGARVGQAPNLGPGSVALWDPSVWPCYLGFGGPFCIVGWQAAAGSFVDEVVLSQATLVSINNGVLVLADTIRAVSSGPAPLPSTISTLNVRATGMSEVGLTSLRFRDLGLPGRALGNARIASFAGPNAPLIVSNIGSSGQDGIAVDANRARRIGIGMDVPALGQSPSVRFTSRGSNGGNPGLIGTFDVTQVGNGWQFDTDLAPAGATAYRLELFDQGTIVAGPIIWWPFPLCIIVGGPAPCDVAHVIGMGSGVLPEHAADENIAVTHTLAASMPVTYPTAQGPQTVSADAIRIVAEGTAGAVEWISSLRMEARDMPTLQVTTYIHDANHALLHPAAAGTLGLNTLTVNGSSGGAARAVDVGLNDPLAITLDAPNGNGQPFFWLFGMARAAGDDDVYPVPGVGTFCLPPSLLEPQNPELFMMIDTFGDGLFPTPPGPPWTSSLTRPGIPLGLEFTLQGVYYDPATSAFDLSNGVLTRLL